MQVDIEHPMPVFNTHLVDHCRRGKNAGIVDQYVQPAKGILHFLEHSLYLIVLGCIHRHGKRSMAVLLDLLASSLGSIPAQVRANDVGSELRQDAAELLSQAGPAARD